MTKYTKRQYVADTIANAAAIAANKMLLESFNDRLESGETLTETWSNEWNAAHDREYELEQERFEIERRWSQRNWTWADHSHHDLVMQNID